jgi:hypothetical protein
MRINNHRREVKGAGSGYSTAGLFFLLIPQQRARSQQRRFQLQECAQQFVRMDDVAATFALGVNDPTAAVSGGNCTAIAP